MTNLKKAAITSILVLLFVIGVAIISLAGNTGVITKEAKLRKTASNDSTVLEIIPNKEEVEILEETDDWYKVKYNKIKGYVQKDYIKVEEVKNAETNTVQETNQVTNESEQKLKTGDTAIVKNETSLYVRPLINSMTIASIEKDKSVTIMEIMNNWAYVATNTTNGWITLDTLASANSQEKSKESTNDNKEETSKTSENEVSENLNKTAYISSSGINFRKEPNTDSEILKTFVQNAKITILSEEGDWYKIQYKEQTGYVIKTYVSDKKVETTSRSAGERKATTTTTEQKTETTNKTTSTTQTTAKSTQSTTATSSNKGQEVANYAKQFVGRKYVYGGANPSKGFDCSGLTMYAYSKFGINLPHSATAQSKIGTKVNRENLQPGDLIFFKNYRTNVGIGHVGIYIGGNKFVHASTEKTGVIISNLSGSYSSRFVCATRLFN